MEVTSECSMVLAGAMLKGSQVVAMCVIDAIFLVELVKILSMNLLIFSIIITQIILFGIQDLKKFVALSSILHCSWLIIITQIERYNINTATMSGVSHAINSSIMFNVVGEISCMTHTRSKSDSKSMENNELEFILLWVLALNCGVPFS